MGLFGGSKTTVSSSTTNTTNVDVGTHVEVGAPDLSPIQRVVDTLSGVNLAAVRSSMVQARATERLADKFAEAVSAGGEGATQAQILVAAIGFLGVLVAAHVIQLPRVRF